MNRDRRNEREYGKKAGKKAYAKANNKANNKADERADTKANNKAEKKAVRMFAHNIILKSSQNPEASVEDLVEAVASEMEDAEKG